ncbi:MAG: hypothetical protein ACOYK1_02440 [Vampirovibrionia bacterium]
MVIQHNQQNFHIDSNNGLLLPLVSQKKLILPEIQRQKLVNKPASDEKLPIIVPDNESSAYSLLNGIFVPNGTKTNEVITLIQAGNSNIHYGEQMNTSLSFNEILHNSLEKIIESEADNPLIKDIKEYFGRLENLSNLLVNRNSEEVKRNNKSSHSPLVMNRETFKQETYYPLKEFSLNSNSLEQLQNIVLKSLKVEDESKSSPAKRFALRFLTNTVFIENFKSEKINQAVIQALKTDKEPAAKKIYEHYLTTQLGNLETSQKKEIIDVLDKNNRLSSHLAQSLFLSEPSLKEGIETKEFPEVKNFEDLEKILDNLHAHSKAAMNQVDLLPSQINPDAKYGIEIEMKLAGKYGDRDDTSLIQKCLKPYAGFVELGIDFPIDDPSTKTGVKGKISELRTLSGGFKLNQENQRNLFEIVNIFHQSPDLMLFLSQHVHLDKESVNRSDSLLSLMKNNNKVTLETKSLDLDTIELNPNNNLVYSYQVPNLIDQMIVLEELKKTKPSADAIVKSFELNKKYGISLGIAQVMLTAVENNKGYLIPNLLRLNSQGKNYLKTHYLAENEGKDLMRKMININRQDVVEFIINKNVNMLTQTDKSENNTLMTIIYECKEELANRIIDKIPEDKLEEVLTQVNTSKRNTLMIALYRDYEELANRTIDKIPKDKLGEVLAQVDSTQRNALMIALRNGHEGLANRIIDKIPKDKLREVLTQTNIDGDNSLMIALNNNATQITERLKKEYKALGLTVWNRKTFIKMLEYEFLLRKY